MRQRLPSGQLLVLTVVIGACAACDDHVSWAGRYEGRFEGTYVATGRLLEGEANLVRSTFAGNAWIEIRRGEGSQLQVHATDCDLLWEVDGSVATFGGEPEPSGCLLDVSGSVGVLSVRPTSGRATLAGDRLELRQSSIGPPHDGGERPSHLSFHFEGSRVP